MPIKRSRGYTFWLSRSSLPPKTLDPCISGLLKPYPSERGGPLKRRKAAVAQIQPTWLHSELATGSPGVRRSITVKFLWSYRPWQLWHKYTCHGMLPASACPCPYTRTHAHTCIYTYKSTHTHTYIYIYIHICRYIFYIYTHTYEFMCVYVCIMWRRVGMSTEHSNIALSAGLKL